MEVRIRFGTFLAVSKYHSTVSDWSLLRRIHSNRKSDNGYRLDNAA